MLSATIKSRKSPLFNSRWILLLSFLFTQWGLCQTALAQPPAQQLGRLITTNADRQRLDDMRLEFLARNNQSDFNADGAVLSDILAPSEDAPQSNYPDRYQVSGFVNRPQREPIVWLNGRALSVSELPDNVTLSAVQSNALDIAVDDRQYTVRSGETLRVATGEVFNSYQESQENQNPQDTSPSNIATSNATAESVTAAETSATSSPSEATGNMPPQVEPIQLNDAESVERFRELLNALEPSN